MGKPRNGHRRQQHAGGVALLAPAPVRKVSPIRKAGSASGVALAPLAQPELRGIDRLVTEMRKDYQVWLAELVLTSDIKSIQVQFATADQNPRTIALAKQLEGLWLSSLSAIVNVVAFGRVAFEKVTGYDQVNNLSIIRKLDALPFEHASLKLDGGAFAGIDLHIDDSASTTLPPDKSWWLAIDAEPIAPHGKSRFIGAPYEVWAERREAKRLRAMFLKRFVIRGGKLHVPKTVEDPETGELLDNFELTHEAIKVRRSGGYVIFDNERDKDGNYLSDETSSPETLDPRPIDDVIDGLDAEMLRAFGIPEKVVTEGQAVGSYATVDQQVLILYCVVEDLLGQIVDCFQKYVIDKSVEMNATGRILATFRSIVQAKRMQELDAPTADGSKPATGGEAGAAAVADQAMNGAQIASMLEVLTVVGAGTLPVESARVALTVAFPTMDSAQIDAILAPFGKGGAAAVAQSGSGSMVTVKQRDWKNIGTRVNALMSQFAAGDIPEAQLRVELGRLAYTEDEINKMLTLPAAKSVEADMTEDV